MKEENNVRFRLALVNGAITLLRKPEEVLKYLTSEVLIEALRDNVDERARLIHQATGMNEKIVRRHTLQECVQNLDLALEEQTITAAQLIEIIPYAVLVPNLTPEQIWNLFADEIEENGALLRAATQHFLTECVEQGVVSKTELLETLPLKKLDLEGLNNVAATFAFWAVHEERLTAELWFQAITIDVIFDRIPPPDLWRSAVVPLAQSLGFLPGGTPRTREAIVRFHPGATEESGWSSPPPPPSSPSSGTDADDEPEIEDAEIVDESLTAQADIESVNRDISRATPLPSSTSPGDFARGTSRSAGQNRNEGGSIHARPPGIPSRPPTKPR